MNELTEDIYKGAEANKQKTARRLTTAQLPVMRELPRAWYRYFSMENRKKVIVKNKYRYEQN